jgi:DNA-3-methyladenine glycosylase II
MTSHRIIETEAHVAEGAAWLAAKDPRFAALLARTGPLPLRRRPDGFAALFDAILGQQVSTASAEAIRLRLEAAMPMRWRAPDSTTARCARRRTRR